MKTYTLNKQEELNHESWVSKLPRMYKKMKFTEWFMFDSGSGIGVTINVRREYTNGDILNNDITDYKSW